MSYKVSYLSCLPLPLHPGADRSFWLVESQNSREVRLVHHLHPVPFDTVIKQEAVGMGATIWVGKTGHLAICLLPDSHRCYFIVS